MQVSMRRRGSVSRYRHREKENAAFLQKSSKKLLSALRGEGANA